MVWPTNFHGLAREFPLQSWDVLGATQLDAHGVFRTVATQIGRSQNCQSQQET